MDLISKFYDSDNEKSEQSIHKTDTQQIDTIDGNKVDQDNQSKDKDPIKNKDESFKNKINNSAYKEEDANGKQEFNSSEDKDFQEEIINKINNKLQTIEYAPDVNVQDLVLQKDFEKYEKFNSGFFVPLKPNHLTGYINYHTMNDFNFNEQYYNFNAYGFAQDPTDFSGNRIIGDLSKFEDSNIAKGVFDNNKNSKECRKKLKMKRFKYGDAGSGEFMGPWAIYEGEEIFKNMSGELTEEQKEILKQIQEKKQKKLEEEKSQDTAVMSFRASSIFHLEQDSDYQGRSFIDPPPNLKNVDHTCYIPKKLVTTYTGHTKPVQVIKFFPKFGHFILSCSLDNKVKLWDVMSHKKCVRTYMGHTEGVRDICFTNDGKHFLSAGFDKVIQYWDTETGKVVKSFNIKKIPFCIVLHPDEDKQNQFLVGTSSKKIIQYDINTGGIIQSYDEHLGAINTLTFIDNNRKFVSTSDDKKIFIWEYGLPVVVKHISEPSMHSIPATALHPNGKYFVGQSLDNKVVVYDCKNGFKINRKKKFIGHVNAGYACGLDFSPDGQFLASGDADGKLWFWDWRTNKNYRVINAHEKVCIDVKWHPIESSKVATCSWDGTIKLWD